MKNWIIKNSLWLSLLLVLAVMAAIFCFSAQTGEESGEMSGRLTKWVLSLIVRGFEDMTAEAQESLRSTAGLIVRKLGHFTEYALLGVSLMLHLAQIQKRTKVPLPWLISWGVGTLYAASDEFHQGFVAGRGPSVVDVMIDSAGVIAGVLLMLWILSRVAKSRRKCYN